MSYKLYADNRCVVEIMDKFSELELASPNDLREKAGYDKVDDSKEEKKIYNCPNCGAPISGYICEYCGTEFEKPKKKLLDEEMRESFDELVRKQRQAELQASQEWQTQNLLNTINGYNVNTQIMNMRDSINSAMVYQTCSLYDQMHNASMLTNIYPANHSIEQKEKPLYIESVNKEADEELATVLKWFMIGMVIFTLLVIGVTAIYNL